jgi:ribonuclease BN (tRNA processing enzyme)
MESRELPGLDPKTQPESDSITFLGTGGARFMIISQLLASGGIWLNLNGTQILVDPGPGCIVQVTKRKLKPEKLSAIIVSHRHLDHSGDVNVMVEAMTQGGLRPRGKLFAPSDAFNSEPIIFSYLKNSLKGIEILQEGKSYEIGSITFTTPVRHIHPVETYGMVFKTPNYTLSYNADTHYFDGLVRHYGGDVLVINTVFLAPVLPGGDHILPVEHLSVSDAAGIISQLKPKVAILTHFGMNVWRARPWEIAQAVSEETGVKVVAARDGMRFDLTRLPDQQPGVQDT